MSQDKNNASEKITIVRKAKKNNYSIISNLPVRNTELSWKSKGILWYLLQLPDDWKINLVHLEKQSTDGRESLKSGFKELKEKGYIEHQTLREKGKIVGHIWIVHETPILNNDTEYKEPEAGKPSSGFTTSGESATTNNLDSESKDSESILKTKNIVATDVALSADADDICSFFIEKLKERKPDFKIPDRKRWTKDIDQIIRIDKRDPKKIRAMIDWIHRDSFWSANILSPKKLRDQYDQIELQALRKNQVNVSKMNREYAVRLKFKYPESYKNLVFGDKYVCNRGTGKELNLNLPYANFKQSFVGMFGVNYDDLSDIDKK